jgi:hypothetical protein
MWFSGMGEGVNESALRLRMMRCNAGRCKAMPCHVLQCTAIPGSEVSLETGSPCFSFRLFVGLEKAEGEGSAGGWFPRELVGAWVAGCLIGRV